MNTPKRNTESYNKTIDSIERKGLILQANILRNVNNDLIKGANDVLQTSKELFEKLLNKVIVTTSMNKVYEGAEEYPTLEEVIQAINQ